jgi:hypothetical protein
MGMPFVQYPANPQNSAQQQPLGHPWVSTPILQPFNYWQQPNSGLPYPGEVTIRPPPNVVSLQQGAAAANNVFVPVRPQRQDPVNVWANPEPHPSSVFGNEQIFGIEKPVDARPPMTEEERGARVEKWTQNITDQHPYHEGPPPQEPLGESNFENDWFSRSTTGTLLTSLNLSMFNSNPSSNSAAGQWECDCNAPPGPLRLPQNSHANNDFSSTPNNPVPASSFMQGRSEDGGMPRSKRATCDADPRLNLLTGLSETPPPPIPVKRPRRQSTSEDDFFYEDLLAGTSIERLIFGLPPHASSPFATPHYGDHFARVVDAGNSATDDANSRDANIDLSCFPADFP